MKQHRKKGQERGFALIVVVMIVAAISLVAVTLLNFVNLDVVIAGQNRKTFEARAVADCAAFEVLDHADTPGLLPDFASNNLQYVASDPHGIFGAAGTAPAGTSYCITPGTLDKPAQDYSADVRLLRYVPLTESSLNWSRALVYELRTIGEIDNGDATSEVRAEIWRVASYAPGTLLPRIHAR